MINVGAVPCGRPRVGRHRGLPLQNQRGFALLLSLLIIFLMVVIILEADFQVRADLRAAGNFRDDLKAFYLARSAVSAAEALLKDDTQNSNTYDGLDEFWAFPIPEYPLGDGFLSGSLVDEERKININFLVTKNSGGDRVVESGRKAQLERLFRLLEVDPELVDPIVDWLDSDNETLPYGAEEGAYQGRDPSYSPANGPFETLQELHMVEGITDKVYKKIAPYLTIYGKGQVNVNTADSLLLQSFDEGIDETAARIITGKRPFDSVGEFKTHLKDELNGVYQRMLGLRSLNWLAIKSNYFLLSAEGRVDRTRKIARAVIKRTGRKTQRLYFRVE